VSGRNRIALIFAALGAVAFGLVWGAVHLTDSALAGGFAAAAAVGAAGVVVARSVLRPARRLARGLRAVVESRSSDPDAAAVRAPMLGDLPEACDALVTALRGTRREARKAAQSESAHVEAQKAWLESVLQGLSEGVFVCDPQHRIMLYNAAAVELLDAPDRIGLGRRLGDLLDLSALLHGLHRLEDRHRRDPQEAAGLSAPFVCVSADGKRTFQGRMALLVDGAQAVSGYLVTLVDMSGEVALLAKGDEVRRALTRDIRGMVGNLRAAAETIAGHPEMPAADRAAFEAVLVEESVRLSDKIDGIGREIRGHMLGRWPMADISSADLARLLDQNVAEDGLSVTLIGTPLWLRGDSLSLIRALEFVLRRLAEETGAKTFDLEPMLGDTRVYLDLAWRGAPVPEGVLESWLDRPYAADSDRTLRDVLERHGSEPWSKPAERDGYSVLRVPLLAPDRPQFMPERKRLPPRPEFYDAGLMRAHQGDAELAARPLRDVPFVVFDCEMTGLQPNQGDEIIQIGAVRVVGGRVLTGEAIEWLVDPGRPIPPGSIKFHGLTDADVAGKPGIGAVLPEFRHFVGDAVMVAHNAAFDMKFLAMREREAGVRFDTPVLDTMLISSLLDGVEEDHSLDALCDRYGISITARHSALADTIGTAQILLHFIDRLEAKGLTTFGEVMKATNMAAELRHRGAVVGHGTGTGG
jgi:DNA polymerase-3 subunit epsilon